MTETDTPDHQDKRPATNPATPVSLLPATQERKWIHDYFRNPVADKVAHKQTRIERKDGLLFATGHSKE